MSRSIDERIVAMHFENEQFEKGAKQSIRTLNELKQGLDFEGVGESLESVSNVMEKGFGFKKATRETNLFSRAIKGIGNAATYPLRALTNGFNSLNHYLNTFMGFNIASKLVNTGEQILKTFTIDPLKTGWNEYELKLDSIKTIMTGTTAQYKKLLGENYTEEAHLEIVKKYLEELNKYADDTIYKFSDMTSNIGKFTNNGVDLEKATASMKGIANAAAQAGQGTNEASRAMYNLSQAIGVGKLTTIDWRSIEFANMATLEFKQAFIDVAYAMGKLKKTGDKYFTTTNKKLEVTAENFRETLSEGWADKDVIVATLAAYSGDFDAAMLEERFGITREVAVELAKTGKAAKKAATEVRTFSKMFDALKESVQSGWAISWELIFGDMHEATNLWTKLNERFDKMLQESAERRNDLLRGWRGEVKNKDAKVVSEEIEGWFKEDKWNRAYGMETWFQEEDAIGKMVRNVFDKIQEKGTGPEAVAEIVKYLNSEYKIKEEDALKIVNRLNEFYNGLEYTKKNGRTAFIDGILEFVDSFELIKKAFSEAKIAIFGEVTSESLQKISDKFKETSDKLAQWLGTLEDADSRINKIKKIFEGFFAILKIGKTAFAEFGKRTLNTFKQLFPGFDETFKKLSPTIDWLIKIADQFEKDRSFKNLFDNIKKRISSRWVNVKASVTKTFNDMKKIFSEKGLGGVISEIGSRIRKALESWGIDLSPIDNLRKNLSEKCHNLATSIEEFFGLETGTLTNLWGRIREVIGGIGIKDAAEEGEEKQSQVDSALESIDKVSSTINNIKTSIETFISWVKEANWEEIGSAFYDGMIRLETGLIGVGAGLGVFGTGRLFTSLGKRLGKVSIGVGDLVDVDIGQSTLETVAETLSPTNELLTGTAKLLLEFSASLYFMADAINTLSQIPMPDIQKAVGALGELSGLFAAFQGIMKLENYGMSMMVNKNLGKGGSLFGESLYSLTKGRLGVVPGSNVSESLSFVLALKEMVNDVVKLAQIEDPSHVDKAIEAIAKLSALFAAFEALTGLARNLTGLIGSTSESVSELGASSGSWFFGMFKSTGKSVSKQFSKKTLSNVTGSKITESLSFILALKGMIDAVVELSKIEDPGRVDKAISAIAKLEGIFTAFETIIMLIGKLGGLIAPSVETIATTASDGATSLITKKLAGKGSNALGSLGLLVEAEGFITALSGMIDAVIRLASIEDPSRIDKAVTAIAELSGLFAGFESILKLSNAAIGMIGGTGERLSKWVGKSTRYVPGATEGEAKSYIMVLSEMIDSVIELAKIEDPGRIDKAIAALTELTGLFAGFETVMKLENSLLGLIAGNPTLEFGNVKLPLGGRSTNYVAGGTLKDSLSFVIVIKEMIDGVIELAKIEDPARIDKAIEAIEELTKIFASFETVMKLENNLLGLIAGNPTLEFGKNVKLPLGGRSGNYVAGGTLKDSVSFFIAIKGMIDGVIELAKIEDPSKMNSAIQAIQSLTTIFTVFESVMKIEQALMDEFYKKGSIKKSATAFSTAANVASLAYGIKSVIDGIVALASIEDSAKVNNALGVVTGLTGLFEVFDGLMKIEQMMMDKYYKTSSLKKTTNSLSTAVNIVSLTKGVEGMIDGIVELAKVGDRDSINAAVLTITELTGLFVAYQSIMDTEKALVDKFGYGGKGKSFGEQISDVVSTFTNTFSLIPALTTLVESVAKLASLDPGNIEKATECVGKLTLIFTLFNGLTDLEVGITSNQTFGNVIKAQIGLILSTVALIVGINALVLGIEQLAKVEDPSKLESAVDIVTKLSGFIVSFSLVTSIIASMTPKGASIGGMAKAALSIGLALIIFATVIGTFATVIGGLTHLTKDSKFSESVLDGILSFIDGLGQIWNKLREAFSTKAKTPEGDEAGQMVEQIASAASEVSKVNTEDLKKLEDVIALTKNITDLLNTWGKDYIFGGHYEDFASEIVPIAQAVHSFATEASSIFTDPNVDISKADEMASMLQRMMSILTLGSLYWGANAKTMNVADWVDMFTIATNSIENLSEAIGDDFAYIDENGKIKSVIGAFATIGDEFNAAIVESASKIDTTPFISAIVAGIKTPSNRKDIALALIEMGNRLYENGLTLPDYTVNTDGATQSYNEILAAFTNGGEGFDLSNLEGILPISNFFKSPTSEDYKKIFSGIDADAIKSIFEDENYGKIDIATAFEVTDVAPIVADLISKIQTELDKPNNSLSISLIPQWGKDDMSMGTDIASLIGPISISQADITSITSTITDNIDTNTSKIVTAISSLSGDISGIATAISEMQIVIDGGAVAGAVDKELGKKYDLDGRKLFG